MCATRSRRRVEWCEDHDLVYKVPGKNNTVYNHTRRYRYRTCTGTGSRQMPCTAPWSSETADSLSDGAAAIELSVCGRCLACLSARALHVWWFGSQQQLTLIARCESGADSTNGQVAWHPNGRRVVVAVRTLHAMNMSHILADELHPVPQADNGQVSFYDITTPLAEPSSRGSAVLRPYSRASLAARCGTGTASSITADVTGVLIGLGVANEDRDGSLTASWAVLDWRGTLLRVARAESGARPFIVAAQTGMADRLTVQSSHPVPATPLTSRGLPPPATPWTPQERTGSQTPSMASRPSAFRGRPPITVHRRLASTGSTPAPPVPPTPPPSAPSLPPSVPATAVLADRATPLGMPAALSIACVRYDGTLLAAVLGHGERARDSCGVGTAGTAGDAGSSCAVVLWPVPAIATLGNASIVAPSRDLPSCGHTLSSAVRLAAVGAPASATESHEAPAAHVLEVENAVSVAVHARAHLIAIGRTDGVVHVHSLLASSGVAASVSLEPWGRTPSETGAACCVAFSHAGDTLAVGYARRGAALFATCGTLCALWPVRSGGLSLGGGALAHGTGAVAWGPADSELVVAARDTVDVALPHAPRGAPPPSTSGMLQGCVWRLALLRDVAGVGVARRAGGIVGAADESVTLLGNAHVRVCSHAAPLAWRVLEVPASYLERAWPLRTVAASAGRVAVGGSRGVAVHAAGTRRWRYLGASATQHTPFRAAYLRWLTAEVLLVVGYALSGTAPGDADHAADGAGWLGSDASESTTPLTLLLLRADLREVREHASRLASSARTFVRPSPDLRPPLA